MTRIDVDPQAKPAVSATEGGFVVRASHRVSNLSRYLYHSWERLQVSHRGAYTARRALALERYCRSTSLLRVLVVCVATPLPMLVFVLTQAVLPLDPPSAGWQSNTSWFLNYAVIFGLLSLGCVCQASRFLTSVPVSVPQALAISTVTGGIYISGLVALSAAWVFPIPFVFGLTGAVYSGILVAVGVFVLRLHTLKRSPELLAQVQLYNSIVTRQGCMCFLYPTFNAVFRALEGELQLAFLAVLFLIKVAMRFSIAEVFCRPENTRDINHEPWNARLPEFVVFTTELFHVLYLTTCLQGAEVTMGTTLALVCIDVITSALNVRRLLLRFSALMTAERNSGKKFSLIDSPGRCIAVHPLPQTFSTAAKSTAYPHLVITQLQRFCNWRASRKSSTRVVQQVSIGSANSVALFQLSPSTPGRQSSKTTNITQSLDDARLQLLSMVEYFILVEYVECIIPAMYGIYMAVLARQPNAAYYPTLANATEEELRASHTNIAVFVALEILSLIAFAWFLGCRLHFSVLHQLAFVLETAALDVQAKFAMFIPYCVFFFLEHNGVDFSFQFAWMQQRD